MGCVVCLGSNGFVGLRGRMGRLGRGWALGFDVGE